MREIGFYAASLFIGLSLGLIGAGGAILTIPVFVYIVGTDPISATVYSMFVVGSSSLIGGIRALLRKLVDINMVVLFGAPSVIGVFLSRRLIFPAIPAVIFSTHAFTLSKNILLMGMLSIVMFFASIKMLRPKPVTANNNDGQPVKTGILMVEGFLVGLLTALLGVGGGFLIVPALHLLARVPMKMAIGTALVIITINATVSFFNAYTTITIDWPLLLRFTAGAAIGILIGTKLSEKVSGNYLKKIFGLFILFISFFTLYKIFFSGF